MVSLFEKNGKRKFLSKFAQFDDVKVSFEMVLYSDENFITECVHMRWSLNDLTVVSAENKHSICCVQLNCPVIQHKIDEPN